jgi:CubicO group peptidase (beta-lactamase class C family)
VKQRGAITYSRGYGLASLEQRVPITPRTVFDVGSVSKQFTAASIMLLAIDGKLSLDDDVRRFLPELPDLGARVTIRHLLTHTSGWHDYTDIMVLDGWDERDHTTNREAWDALRRQRALNFAPGSTFRYDNTGYFLLGEVVSRVSGQSLAAFAHDRMFAPLGMTSTRFLDDTRQIVPERATGYAPAEKGFVVEMSNWDQIGDGGVQTSVEDLARWESNFDSPRVGGAPLLRLMLTHGRLNDGRELAYTAGLTRDSYRGMERVVHGGAWAGYRAMLMRFPEDRLSLLLTCNRADANTTALAQGVADVLIDSTKHPRMTIVGTTTREDYTDTAVGMYASDAEGGVARFEAREHVLWGGGALPLPRESANRFVDPSSGVRFTFSKDRVVIQPPAGIPDTLHRVNQVSSLPASALREYVGTYASPEVRGSYDVVLHRDTLWVHLWRGDDIALSPIYTDAFGSDALPIVRFVRDGAGRVIAMSFTDRGVHDLRLERIGSRK